MRLCQWSCFLVVGQKREMSKRSKQSLCSLSGSFIHFGSDALSLKKKRIFIAGTVVRERIQPGLLKLHLQLGESLLLEGAFSHHARPCVLNEEAPDSSPCGRENSLERPCLGLTLLRQLKHSMDRIRPPLLGENKMLKCQLLNGLSETQAWTDCSVVSVREGDDGWKELEMRRGREKARALHHPHLCSLLWIKNRHLVAASAAASGNTARSGLDGETTYPSTNHWHPSWEGKQSDNPDRCPIILKGSLHSRLGNFTSRDFRVKFKASQRSQGHHLRCENRLWEQRFLLLLFRLAKDQFSAIHHKAHYEAIGRFGLKDTCLCLLVQVILRLLIWETATVPSCH
ncbi:hypothetical protein AV530_007304 [Patagioenas fasciata monilis]|uniref:Uncharacterized protein n=1 Tax=Patagioenas fasciata monilis TaxID=372326 RepID=A0A1V4JXA6_PATFA|nr:hypothetical protein AV530_007304 [Patagioenas fasciata monilis]